MSSSKNGMEVKVEQKWGDRNCNIFWFHSMALSFYSNWEMDNLNPILDPAYDDDRSEVADALIAFLDPIDVPIDSLFENTQTDELFIYTGTSSSNLLPCHSDRSVLTLSSKLHPEADEFDRCKCPKRPRSCSDLYRPPPRVVLEGGSYNGPCVGALAGMSGWQPMTDFVIPPAPAEGGSSREKKKKSTSSSGCLSAQSMAARERRKRISEKTRELDRLIPGGRNKMNTAGMFQAAFKYVKFLQAQAGILEVMDSVQGSSEVDEQLLQVLVTSPTIQEKLYGEGKCIVSTQAAKALSKEAETKSTSVISRDLDRFFQSI